ncbi:mitochondrial genome maintenance MGM101-domain-containing protein [Myxozyma melibiosi]|uniref:Mitochondrial genome maintenance protein MGM101 n=1 Tax=Myxozyma melibiosi TaxID=54550 RepID=A0ABR1F9F8_9ASCO
MDAISSIDFVDPKEAVVPTREPPASYLAKAQKAHTPSYSRSSSAPYSSSSYKSSSSRSSSDGGNSHVFATLEDVPLPVTDGSTDWARSFQGIGSAAYPPEIAEILSQELEPDWIEIKPDGILYLPEIHYRRILNKAFGPGGWGLVPRSETVVSPKTVSREFGLVCHGRLVSIARGEQIYFDAEGVPTASEGCKSNAMMRCCKDLGVASELWDPRFIRRFKKTYCDEAFVEHISTKRKKKMWKRKDVNWEYPYRSASF